MILGVLLGGLALLASWWGTVPFLVFVILIAAGAALDLDAVLTLRGIQGSQFALLAAAGVLPIVAYWRGEPRVGMAIALVVIGIASLSIVRGLRPGVLMKVAVSVFGAMWCGLLGAFCLLVRQSPDGPRLVATFALLLGGYQAGSWLGASRLGGGPVAPSLGGAPKWWGVAIGLAGSVIGSLVSLTFMGPVFSVSTALWLGVIVAAAALAGDLAGRMIRLDLGVTERRAAVPGLGGLFARLDPLMLAVPAFYYGFRLYLT